MCNDGMHSKLDSWTNIFVNVTNFSRYELEETSTTVAATTTTVDEGTTQKFLVVAIKKKKRVFQKIKIKRFQKLRKFHEKNSL